MSIDDTTISLIVQPNNNDTSQPPSNVSADAPMFAIPWYLFAIIGVLACCLLLALIVIVVVVRRRRSERAHDSADSAAWNDDLSVAPSGNIDNNNNNGIYGSFGDVAPDDVYSSPDGEATPVIYDSAMTGFAVVVCRLFPFVY
jgi:hypothetical protein